MHAISRLMTLIKTLKKDRHSDRWNRKENPETDLHKYAQWIFHKGRKAIQ